MSSATPPTLHEHLFVTRASEGAGGPQLVAMASRIAMRAARREGRTDASVPRRAAATVIATSGRIGSEKCCRPAVPSTVTIV